MYEKQFRSVDKTLKTQVPTARFGNEMEAQENTETSENEDTAQSNENPWKVKKTQPKCKLRKKVRTPRGIETISVDFDYAKSYGGGIKCATSFLRRDEGPHIEELEEGPAH